MELTEVNHGPPEVSNISPPAVSNIGPPEVPLGSEVFEVVNPCKTVDEEDMELTEVNHGPPEAPVRSEVNSADTVF